MPRPEPGTLTASQQHILSAFFSLSESAGYVLAGGAALLATGLSTRPTEDIDLFGSDLARGVALAADALEALCTTRNWMVTRLRDAPTFRRLRIDTDEGSILVDLAIDSPPIGPPHQTGLAPTYPPAELAARKLLALFDRAAARDFADLHTLSRHFDLDTLLHQATQVDPGFDLQVFTTMLRSIDRLTDDDLAATGANPAELRDFYTSWANRLDHQT